MSIGTANLFDVSAVIGQAAPAYIFNGGIWDEPAVNNLAVGNTQNFPLATRSWDTFGDAVTPGGIVIVGNRGVLVASGMQGQAISGAPGVGNIRKDITQVQEAAGGNASVFTDMVYQMMVLQMMESAGRCHILGMGRITGGANPTWLFATGGIDQTTDFGNGPSGILRNGAGDYDVAFLPDQGIDPANTLCIAQIAEAPLFGTSAAINPLAAASQITMLQEGAVGAASVLTDLDVNVIFVAPGARPGNAAAVVHAFGSCNGAAGTYNWASGNVDQTNGINRTGAGAYTIDYLADAGVDPTETVTFFSQRGPIAAGALPSLMPGALTALTVPVSTRVEQAGAASILADINFDFASFRLN
jgi:hypothetical protein